MKYVVTFSFCMVTWVLLSGLFDPFHLSLGVFSALLVTFGTGKMLFQSQGKSMADRTREVLLLPGYAIWLLIEIVKANVSLLILAYSPNVKSRINPRVFTFRTSKLHDEFSRYVMGISITLVPGTVTIDIDDDEFLVHAITDEAAAGLPDPMESKIAKIFSPGNR